MPRQNRVTPFGEVVTAPERGTLMGNRGLLHDAAGRVRKPFALKRWIACVLAFKGRRRPVMAPGRYTELFFLDEATALAAGHRPCAECQRAKFDAFRRHFPGRSAPAIDDVLHAERLDGRDKRTHRARLDRLPDGAMVALDGAAFLVRGGQLRPWSFGGYGPPESCPADREVDVLTPKSIVRAIAAGYAVGVHPSAEEA